MFSLDTQMVKIDGLDIRTEEQEDDDALDACDIGVEVDLPNTILSDFHPDLKAAFYKADDKAQTDLIDGDSHMPILKFPAFPRFPWKGDFENYLFVAHTGIGDSSEVRLSECKINKFSFQMKDGGTVSTKFIVRAHDGPGDLEKLRKLVGAEVQITLVPPDQAKKYQAAQEKAKRREKADRTFSGAADTSTKDLPMGDDDPDFREVDDAEQALTTKKTGTSKVLNPAEAWPFPTGRNEHAVPADKKPARRKPAAGPSTLE